MELATLRFLLAIARTNIEERAAAAADRAQTDLLGAQESDEQLRKAYCRGHADAFRDVVGTLDRLISLTDGRPF